MSNKINAAKKAVDEAKKALDKAKKEFAADSSEVKSAKTALEVAEGDLNSVQGANKGSINRVQSEIKSKAQEHRDQFAKVKGEGITSTKQAEQVYAISNPNVPNVGTDGKPVEWAYVTYDANIFFEKSLAQRQAARLAGNAVGSAMGKWFAIKLN